MEIIIKMIMYRSILEIAEHKAVVWIVSVPLTSIKGWHSWHTMVLFLAGYFAFKRKRSQIHSYTHHVF